MSGSEEPEFWKKRAARFEKVKNRPFYQKHFNTICMGSAILTIVFIFGPFFKMALFPDKSDLTSSLNPLKNLVDNRRAWKNRELALAEKIMNSEEFKK